MTTNVVRPVVEFLPLYPTDPVGSGRYDLFSEALEDGTIHRHYAGIKCELQATFGLYIFYDSRGRALYAGKAQEQNLWAEMKSVFNRSRDEVQRVKLVRHPERNVKYRTSHEKTRRIMQTPLKLHELASYFSAYEIKPNGMIPMFEALIIRAFANDLLNVKMESF